MKYTIIALCEPQCLAFEHAPFNAALLYMVSLAYPSAKIVFYGETTHIECVRDVLKNRQNMDRIAFYPIRIPKRKSKDLMRLPMELTLCQHVLSKTSENMQALVFCSVTNTGLLALKGLMKLRQINVPTVAFLHGCLSDIDGRQPRRPWKWILGLKRILSFPSPPSLRLIALGDSILKHVKKALPKLEWQWRSMEHVYLWPKIKTKSLHWQIQVHQPIKFGFLGVSNKGFDTFVKLADDVSRYTGKAKFMMAGFYKGPAALKPVSRYISDIPGMPLSRKDFELRLNQLTYVVWTAKPDHYRLTASGTFLDAMAFLKPGIYLRNDYIAHYFDKMGDIGYLCDTFEEMVGLIHDLIADFPAARYQRQIQNIEIGRRIFEPDALSPRFKNIITSCEA